MKHQKVKQSYYKLAALILILFGYLSPAYAASDFEINTDYTVSYAANSTYVSVTESVEIKVNSKEFYLPTGTIQEFQIPDFNFEKDESERQFKLQSIKITDSLGNNLSYQTEELTDAIKITAKQATNITSAKPYTLTFSYNTHELVNQNGQIINLYVPGLPKDTPFTHRDEKNGLITEFTYDTKLELIGEVPEASYIQPQSIKQTTAGNKKVFTISQDERLGKSVWIQLGNKQYYYFKIAQQTPKTDNLIPTSVSNVTDLVSTNVFTLPLPRNYDETNQRVYIKSITPKPSSIETDYEGNLTALFEVPANETSEIIIEGYISLESSLADNIPNLSLSDYKSRIASDENLQGYTVADKYWESDNAEIKAKSDEILEGKTTILDFVHGVYFETIELLDYSADKVSGENIRSGALSTLNGAPAVCMEYADLAVALLRAQGIPARAAVGYGNDPTGVENKINDSEAAIQQIGHQWVQVWIPDYGWYSIDPTWGESGRTYLGSNLDHLLWYTLGNSSQESLGGTSLSSADSVDNKDFTAYSVYIQSLSEVDYTAQNRETVQLAEYLMDYEDSNYSVITYFLKTTVIGRALIVSAPVIFLIVVLFIISSIFFKAKKRASKNSNSAPVS